MPSPRDLRRICVQILFAFDAQQEPSPDLARQVAGGTTTDAASIERSLQHATDAWQHRKLADDWIARHAPQWPTHRQPAVDRAILRFAVWEMTSTKTPVKVVIDEAIEISKEFSTENSPAFINGVLDAVLKEIESLKTSHPASVEADSMKSESTDPDSTKSDSTKSDSVNAA
jgi:N utilization substance protein B